MSLIEDLKEVPLYIKINPIDNVAIVVNSGGLPEGTVLMNYQLGIRFQNHCRLLRDTPLKASAIQMAVPQQKTFLVLVQAFNALQVS
ncbi:MAG: galactarate dehydratase [Firmicutes bacterium]|nr:galactarate dehydratase [Bacillota bacterium]